MAKKATKPRSSRPAKPTTIFRPRASSTYSSAVSAMRTQKLPAYCSSSGRMTKASAPSTQVILLTGGRRAGKAAWTEDMRAPSGAVGHAFAQQARGSQREDEDQDDEGEDVGVV